MNKVLTAVIVMTVLQIAQSEILTLAVLSVAAMILVKWLLKGAAERE